MSVGVNLAKLIVTDGIALLKLSVIQRWILGRRYVAFDLGKILKVSAEETPGKSELGQKAKLAWLPWSKTGEYVDGAKRTLFIGLPRQHCVRILLLNPDLNELYLTSGKQFQLFAVLKEHQNSSVYRTD